MNVLDQKKEMCLSFDTPPSIEKIVLSVSLFIYMIVGFSLNAGIGSFRRGNDYRCCT